MKMKDKYRADSFTSDKGVTEPSGTWQIKHKIQHQKEDYKDAHTYLLHILMITIKIIIIIIIENMYRTSYSVCLNRKFPEKSILAYANLKYLSQCFFRSHSQATFSQTKPHR